MNVDWIADAQEHGQSFEDAWRGAWQRRALRVTDTGQPLAQIESTRRAAVQAWNYGLRFAHRVTRKVSAAERGGMSREQAVRYALAGGSLEYALAVAERSERIAAAGSVAA